MSVVFYRGVYHVGDYLLLDFEALSKWREKLLLSVLNDLILLKLLAVKKFVLNDNPYVHIND